MSKDLWALDFDGVVCNSVGESSKSAWQVGMAFAMFVMKVFHDTV